MIPRRSTRKRPAASSSHFKEESVDSSRNAGVLVKREQHHPEVQVKRERTEAVVRKAGGSQTQR